MNGRWFKEKYHQNAECSQSHIAIRTDSSLHSNCVFDGYHAFAQHKQRNNLIIIVRSRNLYSDAFFSINNNNNND